MVLVEMKSGIDCVMVNAYGIILPVMANVVRGIFYVMAIATKKSIGKNVMEGVFGRPSHVRHLWSLQDQLIYPLFFLQCYSRKVILLAMTTS